MPNSNYDRDFYAWANEQAALLRTGQLGQADIANIAEEIESLGRTEKRELVGRLTVLLFESAQNGVFNPCCAGRPGARQFAFNAATSRST